MIKKFISISSYFVETKDQVFFKYGANVCCDISFVVMKLGIVGILRERVRHRMETLLNYE